MPSLDFEQEQSRFLSFHDQHRSAMQAVCDAYVALVDAQLAHDGTLDISKVEGRVKDRDECIRKFSRKYRAGLEENGTPYEIRPFISDLIGIRVVCLYEDELEKVAQAVQNVFDVIDVTDKTYTIELTGDASKLDAFIEAIDRAAILETVRTGTSGIGRGERILRV